LGIQRAIGVLVVGDKGVLQGDLQIRNIRGATGAHHHQLHLAVVHARGAGLHQGGRGGVDGGAEAQLLEAGAASAGPGGAGGNLGLVGDPDAVIDALDPVLVGLVRRLALGAEVVDVHKNADAAADWLCHGSPR